MAVVIENPILNSPYAEPARHYRFDDETITNEIVEGRRKSAYFIPIPQPKKKGGKLDFDAETKQRREETKLVNDVRQRVGAWRQGGHVGVTPTTQRLLAYWTAPERGRPLFFCQIEAVETAIYLTEVASKYGDGWMLDRLRDANDQENPGLPRIAFKMATGSGKTVVMAMLIAWQALNKIANRQSNLHSDSFLIVTPGITIRDRLRVLWPNDPGNYYRERDVLPAELIQRLGQANIVITNFHSFMLRERGEGAALTKRILAQGESSPFKETPDDMVRRALRALGPRKNIVVINDEAHHCYQPKSKDESADAVDLKGEEREEAERDRKQAQVWLSGLEAVDAKLGIRSVYDLSATPFFLKGSGRPEGTLFPWVVSDFALIDAIESGIVKIPRVPVADDRPQSGAPTYRTLWAHVRDGLPTGKKASAPTGEPKLPAELQSALHSLYGHYHKGYDRWESTEKAKLGGDTPPVFVVVCANVNVSKLVFDYVSGWEKELPEPSVSRTALVPGALDLFSNVSDGKWLARPNTILVDSQQFESGEGMSAEFKKIAATEIEEFKQEFRLRFPDRDVDALTDEDLLREVLNTVGKPGKLGEHIRCVVSVSMLTEGWDVNTVTHILGIRAFSTQLLCEQVVGRGLRRRSYSVTQDGKFPPEYAEVYGVPFSFIPTAASGVDPETVRPTTRVRALDERRACEITFPRILGYRYDLPTERLNATFTMESRYSLGSDDVPLITENSPIVGESSVHTLDDLKEKREAQVAFLVAKLVIEKYFRTDGTEQPGKTTSHRFEGQVQSWLFPQVLEITKRWMRECLDLKDNAFPQMLLLMEFAHDASDRIYRSIVRGAKGQPRIKARPQPYDTIGSTRYVDFDTLKPTFATRADKSHVTHVVADTGSWEQATAFALEQMDEVVAYVKNQGLEFVIPYVLNGDEKKYYPDFLARVNDGHGAGDLLNVIIEVSGEARKDKQSKVDTAQTLWVPGVNNHGGFGRWAFVEVDDVSRVQTLIRTTLVSTAPCR
jgi:type III restriction enzyme